MKKLVLLFASLFIIVIAAQNVNGQINATSTAATSANIITPISIKKNVDLVFGKIVPTATAGTVILYSSGTRNFTGGAFAFANDNGEPTPAEFTVTGEKGATYSIAIKNSSFTVSNGDADMEVTDVHTTPTSAGNLTEGTQVIKVGATLSVDANQAPGLYQSENKLSITVAYN